MKKFLILVLSLTLTLSFFNLSFFAAPIGEDGFTEITDGAGFAAALSSENAVKLRLAADISVDAATYKIPAGSVIDGGGHTLGVKDNSHENPLTDSLITLPTGGKAVIKNLSFGSADNTIHMKVTVSSAGLPFSLCTNDAADKKSEAEWVGVDFYLNIAATNENANVGGILGQVWGKQILTDCNMNIVMEAANSASQGAGYFTCINADAEVKMTNCTVTEGSYIKKGSYAAGFVSQLRGSLELVDCTNYADVTANNARVAGFVASIDNVLTSMNTFKITGCTNYGDITSLVNTDGAGGIAGSLRAPGDGNAVFKNNRNFGTIAGKQNTAGMIGGLLIDLTVENCLNAGTIKSDARAGGFVATLTSNKTLTVIDCVNIANITGTSSGQFVAHGDAGTKVVSKNSLAYGKVSSGKVDTHGISGITNVGIFEKSTESGTEYLAQLIGGTAVETGDYRVCTKETALATLKTLLGFDFIMGDLNIPVTAAPSLRAVQESMPSENFQKVRLIATINTLFYKEVGFYVTVLYTDAQGEQKVFEDNKKCDYVYSKINGRSEEGTVLEVSAKELGGSYIIALSLLNIPTNCGNVDIIATPFALSGETLYKGTTYRITYTNGVLTQTTEQVPHSGNGYGDELDILR